MIGLLATRGELVGSLRGAILAPQWQVEGEDRTVVWRGHDRSCAGPSNLALTLEALAGKALARPDDVLTCVLRFCPEREILMRAARRDPRLLWLALEHADQLPRAAEPVGVRASMEAGVRDVERLRAAGPGEVHLVPVTTYTIDAAGVRHERLISWGVVGHFEGDMGGTIGHLQAAAMGLPPLDPRTGEPLEAR